MRTAQAQLWWGEVVQCGLCTPYAHRQTVEHLHTSEDQLRWGEVARHIFGRGPGLQTGSTNSQLSTCGRRNHNCAVGEVVHGGLCKPDMPCEGLPVCDMLHGPEVRLVHVCGRGSGLRTRHTDNHVSMCGQYQINCSGDRWCIVAFANLICCLNECKF